MIRIDSLWPAVDPIDGRVGTQRLHARVVQVFGGAQPTTATCSRTRGHACYRPPQWGQQSSA